MLENKFVHQRSLILAEKVRGTVDAVLCTNPDNIYYFSGFRTTLYTRFIAVLIRMDRSDAPILIVSTIDKRMIEDRIWSPPWVADILYHGPDQQPGIAPSPAAALASHLVGIERIGVDSLRLAEVDQLHEAAADIQIVQIASQIDAVKLNKDAQELAYLKQANLLAMHGLAGVPTLLKTGPTITEIGIAVQLEADARMSGADGFGYPTLVSSGGKMAAIHSPALHRRVEPDQPLRIAFGPTVEGYTADIVRTFCLGKPSEELIRLQDGYLAALEGLLKMIRPGVKVAALVSAVEEIYTQRGIRNFWRNSIGHGVGITVHEPPRLVAGSETILSDGMVLAVEPFLVVPGLGGYAQCDVLIVKDSGPEILAEGPQGIIVVPMNN
jgi:Xaa-Pro aminopeptidase